MWGGIATGIGSLISGITGASLGRKNTKDMIASNEKIAEQNFQLGQETNEMNWDIAKMNADISRRMNEDNIQFQMNENAIAREREDTAVSRRAEDLQNAGLSKTLAAGSAASSQSMTAPQRRESEQIAHTQAYIAKEMKYDALQNMDDLTGITNSLLSIMNGLVPMQELAQKKKNNFWDNVALQEFNEKKSKNYWGIPQLEFNEKKSASYWDKDIGQQIMKDFYTEMSPFLSNVMKTFASNFEDYEQGDAILKYAFNKALFGNKEGKGDKKWWQIFF